MVECGVVGVVWCGVVSSTECVALVREKRGTDGKIYRLVCIEQD